MADDLYIYRSCNRPKYVEATLLENIRRTSNNGKFLVFDNSDEEYRAEIRDIFLKVAELVPDRNLEIEFSRKARIGGTKAVYRNVDKWAKETSKPRYVFVVDDDVLLPEAVDGETWDEVLMEMLDAGWDVVAHPWGQSFREKETKTIGGVKGYPYGGVNGGCSAFSYKFYRAREMRQLTLIRGYNEWMVRSDEGKNGYSYNKQMLFEHIDRPDHPLSLRDTEYCDWSDDMYYERFPKAKKQGKKRPKGMDGVW